MTKQHGGIGTHEQIVDLLDSLRRDKWDQQTGCDRPVIFAMLQELDNLAAVNRHLWQKVKALQAALAALQNEKTQDKPKYRLGDKVS